MSTWYTPKRLERLGYVKYGLGDHFVEDIDLISRLLGSICYETLQIDDQIYIRRSD